MFSELEIEDILREFEKRFKRGMTDRDWKDYCMCLDGRTRHVLNPSSDVKISTACIFNPL